ncbi:MAG: UvrD-helicase domain-containing protein [Actinomycetes bacterium]
MNASPTPFDLVGPVPRPGITLLEASAGTGKTFTIAALFTRYVAQGVPIRKLLVITFTRLATGELRERVRERLVSAHRQLGQFLDTGSCNGDDALVGVLAQGDLAEVRTRHRRLAEALSDFDAATITTTHGFCLDALAALGLSGDPELNPKLAPDVGELVDQVAIDEYVRTFLHDEHPMAAKDVRDIVGGVNSHFYARITPDSAAIAERPVGDGDDLFSDVRRRVELAVAARSEIDRRKRMAGDLTYDDMISRLRDAVTHPVRGDFAVATLRDRYSVVLVDEFQDTDSLQWEVLSRTFDDGVCTLLLIGDPKQAIYAFRGADIHAYLAAAGAASRRRTLGSNFRSDAGLLAALDTLFGSLQLGDPQIQYRTVAAGVRDRGEQRIGPLSQPLRLRVMDKDTAVAHGAKTAVIKASADAYIAADLAADVVRRLNEGVALPQDMAVLVGKHKEAALIRQALSDVGVPAVIRGSTSVFSTDAATRWLWLLDALERPSSQRSIRRLADSVLVGWSAQQIATADDATWSELHRQVAAWADLLARHGVAALFGSVARDFALLPRLLSTPDGERELTDLQHVSELLNAYSVREYGGPGALAAWLRERIEEASTKEDNERARRLDSDAEAVQVITIHSAKGLEYPIVYCPFLWSPPWFPPDQQTFVYHRDGERVVEVGGKASPTYSTAVAGYKSELLGESLRLAYVALTRAEHELVVWWAEAYLGKDAPLTRILSGTATGSAGAASVVAARKAIDEFAAADGAIAVTRLRERPAGNRWSGVRSRPPGHPEVNTLTRPIDALWCRTSFTGLSSRAYQASVSSEVEPQATVDEPDDAALADFGSAESDDALRLWRPPLAGLPAGPAFGTAVHSILERVDFAAADLAGELVAEAARQQEFWRIPGLDPPQLAEGLAAAIETPLGADVGNLRLRDFRTADRVDELGFEFALVGGNNPVGDFTVGAIRELLREHVQAGDPLVGYADVLDSPHLRDPVRGFMAGSIDVVLRTHNDLGAPQFTVVDYKSNRLAPASELSAWHYRPAALREAMFHANYPLQFMIYTVALHRYLLWRLPGYDPAVNLGPVKYLFLRGMMGPHTPVVGGQPCGVFSWQPPPELICALSDLFRDGVAR